jgi:hypothetical protein
MINLNRFDAFADADDTAGTSGGKVHDPDPNTLAPFQTLTLIPTPTLILTRCRQVHVRVQQRSGRKCVTTVQGLADDLDIKRICKAFKKNFSCNGAVVKDDELGIPTLPMCCGWCFGLLFLHIMTPPPPYRLRIFFLW